MKRKAFGLALVLITILLALLAGLAVTAFAAETNSATNTTTEVTLVATMMPNTVNGEVYLPFWNTEMTMGENGFRGRLGGRACNRGFEGLAERIEISSAYNQTVNSILGNDTDTQKLLNQGYNLTSIRPIVTTALDGEGTLITKANSAVVTLQNGSSEYAIVKVDIAGAKVAEIVIYTRIVIDKTTE